MTRLGYISTRILSDYSDLLVVQDDAGTRYLVGPTARRSDGYAELPSDLLPRVRWRDDVARTLCEHLPEHGDWHVAGEPHGRVAYVRLGCDYALVLDYGTGDKVYASGTNDASGDDLGEDYQIEVAIDHRDLESSSRALAAALRPLLDKLTTLAH